MQRVSSVSGRIALAALAFCACASAANAQGYPDHAITLVVPFPPGGTTDISGRAIAHAMEATLKQTVIVENRAGAGGNIGVGFVARSKPDGYTIVLGTIGTQTINSFLYDNMPYDAEKDFVPIALVSSTPNVLAVNANSKMKTLADVIAAAHAAKGNKLSYATPGVGTSVHLTGAYFEKAAGIELLHVPFKGATASIPAVAGGQVDLLLDNLPSALSQIKDGTRIRGIAVTSAQRSPSLPDLPTFAEAGLPGLDITAWFALYAPRGTPAPVVARLIEAAREGLKSPAMVATLASTGATPGTLFGPDLSAFEKTERARWGALVKERGITAQ
jgi:tripartite-type tricarboxylate transporter receptor subunit TctC